jgi:hypothetical protein
MKYLPMMEHIGDVMVSMLTSGQTKENTIGMCCFSAKHAALRGKNKDGLAQNNNNVLEWNNISTRALLFQ